MKNLIVLFVLALLTSTVYGQSLTEKEITGTWQVINVVNAGSQPQQAEKMHSAYFDIHSDHSFQIRLKKQGKTSKGYENTLKNTTWNYKNDTQTIGLNNENMTIIVSKSSGKMFFEMPETGMKLEVYMPI